MLVKSKRLFLRLVAIGTLVLAVLGYAWWQTFTGDGGEVSPWLYCTTNPCQPLALFPLPTPPALTHDRSLAAYCDFSAPGARDGVLLWHTDWDPRTAQGRCVSSDEAKRLAG